MQAVKTFKGLPKWLQDSIRQSFETKHEVGEDLGTEANIIEQARQLAAERGYAWTPSRPWVQKLKSDDLNIAKRPYA